MRGQLELVGRKSRDAEVPPTLEKLKGTARRSLALPVRVEARRGGEGRGAC
jgi:hypothetical protein